MWDEEPLAGAIGSPALPPTQVELSGITGEFIGGRLARLDFTPPFDALPAGLTWRRPLPAEFAFVRGRVGADDSEVAVLGPLRLQFTVRKGRRTSFSIEAIDDAGTLSHKPLTRVLETSPLTAPIHTDAPRAWVR